MALSRRSILAGAALGAAAAQTAQAGAPPRSAAPRPAPPLPGEFLWGVATAAHQIEGNNQNSDGWLLERVKHTYDREPSGDACDSLHHWAQDVALVKAMGLNTYRFSVEWARIEPEEGFFSTAMLDHYRRICAACREAGITPMVTFHHFTSPRWVAGLGGWEDPGIADLPLAVAQVQAAKAQGVPVLGYIYWSLIDNFEWSSGYVPRFGFYAVDRASFARTPKPSARLYRTLVAKARAAERRRA